MAGSNGFPADDGKMELFREARKTTVGLTDTGSGAGVGAADGDEGGTGSSASGGKVAQSTGECFSTRKVGWSGASEVNAFDHGIGFENEVEIFGKWGEDGAVVT